MSLTPSEIQDVLNRQFKQSQVDVTPIPQNGDRMMKLRTIEAILAEFESDDSSSTSYVVTVKKEKTITSSSEMLAPKPSIEGIYLPNGKLNLAFLTRNAELLFSSGEYTLSRNIYKTIHQAGERAAMALYGMARCFEAEGKLEDARVHYEQSIAYQPTFEALQKLSAILVEQKKDLQAASVFERALGLKDQNDPKTKFELHKAAGNCFTRAKKTEEAETHYQKALGIDPVADEIRSNLGALCLQSGRLADARKHFQDSMASNPRNANALLGLANVFLEQGEKRQAHDHFAKALDVQLNNPHAVFHLVKLAYEIRSYATAARIVENYVEVGPINVNLLYSLAGLQYHLSRRSDAHATATKILQLSPEHSGARELQALIDRNES